MESKAFIFIADDVAGNLKVIGNILMENGYDVAMAKNGKQALKMIKNEKPDLILLDIMMPELNGYDTCIELKKDPLTKNIPVIFLTAKTETEDIVYGFEVGGVDYITKPFKKEELLARIQTHVDLKKSKEKIREQIEAIDRAHTILQGELNKAANYIESIIPSRHDDNIIKTDWIFKPSAELGGDSLGYQWIDDDHLAMYLIDVSGHGIGAALLSVSVINTIRNITLPKTDFKSPSSVLSALNKAFKMEDQNEYYFTIWYGVFNKKSRELVYAGGGHPPALLFDEDSNVEKLESKNVVIAGMYIDKFKEETVRVKASSDIYIFSDGVYEIKDKNNVIWTVDNLIESIRFFKKKDEDELSAIHDYLQKSKSGKSFDDDFTMLKITFK